MFIKQYRYTNQRKFTYVSDILNSLEFENEWLSIKNNRVTINRNYSWDGCSPSYGLFNGSIWIGTPDGPLLEDGLPLTFYASMVHDAMCQFHKDVPLTRQQVSLLFWEMLIVRGMAKWCARLYYWAVYHFGPKKFGAD